MEVSCVERLQRCLDMAYEHEDQSLRNCIHRLYDYELVGILRGCKCTIHLSADFEENSFFFSQHYEDGREGLCGGILFHGYDDQPDNSCAVCVDGPARGWHMHT